MYILNELFKMRVENQRMKEVSWLRPMLNIKLTQLSLGDTSTQNDTTHGRTPKGFRNVRLDKEDGYCSYCRL